MPGGSQGRGCLQDTCGLTQGFLSMESLAKALRLSAFNNILLLFNKVNFQILSSIICHFTKIAIKIKA